MPLEEIILFSVGLIFLLIATYTDIKKREVPDWLNYALIFSALGLRFIFSFEKGWFFFLSGLAGFLVCLGLAYLFYFANWWGGGDSKLLMGMGALIGINLNFKALDFGLLWFFGGLLFFGVILGIIWSLVLAFKKWPEFTLNFKNLINSLKFWHYFSLSLSSAFLILSFFQPYLLSLTFFPIFIFYLLCFVKAVEDACFIKTIGIEKLVEGDWLAQDIFIKGKKIFSKTKVLEKDDLWQLRSLKMENKLNNVLIKEGLPFVPSFLLSYIFITFFSQKAGSLIIQFLS